MRPAPYYIREMYHYLNEFGRLSRADATSIPAIHELFISICVMLIRNTPDTNDFRRIAQQWAKDVDDANRGQAEDELFVYLPYDYYQWYIRRFRRRLQTRRRR